MSISVTVNGVKYRSIKQACKMLNKPLGSVMSRLRNDCSIDQAFNLPNMHGIISRDHLGRIYPTFKDMCQAWDKSVVTIRYRLDKGLDIKTALTMSTSKANGTPSKDHLGNEFCSIKEMCKFWRIKDSTFFSRVDQGMSIEEALTTPVKNIGKGKKSVASNHD